MILKDKLLRWPASGAHALGHPKFGIGHKVVYGKIDADATMESLISQILDPSQLPLDGLGHATKNKPPGPFSMFDGSDPKLKTTKSALFLSKFNSLHCCSPMYFSIISQSDKN